MPLRSTSTVARLFFAFTVAVTTALPAAPASAETEGCSVQLGEVSSAVTRDNVDLHRMLRDAAQTGLENVKFAGVAAARRAILSISLVRMETQRLEHGVKVECVVSATMRRARNGAVFAILDGRAQAEGTESAGALEAKALRVAVQGAVERTPLAVR